MGIVKFKTNYSKDKIERVEVLRETDACIYFPAVPFKKGGKAERREAKRGEFAQYHDTWAEAHAYLMQNAAAKVEGAQFQMEYASKFLDRIKGMTPPTEAA